MALWKREWLVVERDGLRTIPAFDWLRTLPPSVRMQLLAITAAVMSVDGPVNWRDPRSHALMHGDLSGVYEARDKHGQDLYRLFLRWHIHEHRVVMLDGRQKRAGSTLSDSEYQRIRELADLADRPDQPFATVDDFASRILGGDD